MSTITTVSGKRGTTYRARVTVNRKTVSKSFKSKPEARQWCNETTTDLRRGTYKPKNQHTFDELANHYLKHVVPHLKDQINRVNQIHWWQQQLKNISLADLNAPLIAHIRDHQLNFKNDKPLNGATINRYLSSLSALLSYAVTQLEWLNDSPMRKITKRKEPNPRIRYLTQHEMETLLTTAKQSRNKLLYPLIVLACSSGMRLGEMLKLKFSDLNLDEGYALLKNTKNGKDRLVPLSEESRNLLLLFDSSNKQRLVFSSKSSHGKPTNIRSAWNSVIAKSGLKNLRIHDLRHHFASIAVQQNIPLQVVSQLLGHSNLAQTTKYAHLSNEQLFKAVSCIDHAIFKGA